MSGAKAKAKDKLTAPIDCVSIVGMSCIFPGAGNLDDYWNNIVAGVDAISEVPAHRWDPVYYQPESDAVDRFYCNRGGFVDDYVDFDPFEREEAVVVPARTLLSTLL